MCRSLFLAPLCLCLCWLSLAPSSSSEESFIVQSSTQPDEKSVFATIESLDVIPARTRVSGTIAELKTAEGDLVKAGQVLALISDNKNALRIRAANAQIAAQRAEKNNADTELTRARDLFERGILPKSKLDAATARAKTAAGQMRSLSANRNVISQTVREGEVLAPISGRVLRVPVTAGTVVLPGEVMAMIAAENYILRLQIPERHARAIQIGGTIRVDASLLDGTNNTSAKIIKVYPQIREGKVIADAHVNGLGDFFVGERVRVWVPVAARNTILIPAMYLTNRFGLDLVTLRAKDGSSREIIVQRGRQIGDMIEILAGLGTGDEVIAP